MLAKACAKMADAAPLVAVLAAGKGARFGGGKLDAECAGKPLGQWGIDAVAAAGLVPGIIITGATPPAFAAQSQKQGWGLCVNPEASKGQGTSLALAAQIAQARGADLLVLLADMPLIVPSHLVALVRAGGAAATLYSHGSPKGELGVPALLPHAMLAPFTQLAGERGGAAALREIAGLRAIDAPSDMLRDVDTPGDLAHVAALLEAAQRSRD
jgi:CTP:molybdopterin cytidylyltransferase MocA